MNTTPDLAAVAAEIEAEIERLGTPGGTAGAAHRQKLERRVVALCAATQALPAAEARAFADTLARLVAALDAAATRLQSIAGSPPAAPDGTASPESPAADSPSGNPQVRRAAAAYADAAGRRRRGF